MSDSINLDHVALGSKVINYAFNALTFGVATAAAWGCATVLGSISVFIAVAILMALLTALLEVFLMFKLPTTTVESLGRMVGGFTGRFARKTSSLA